MMLDYPGGVFIICLKIMPINYTRDEKRQIMNYIKGNEQILNSWTNYKSQTAVQRYLNNCTGIGFITLT